MAWVAWPSLRSFVALRPSATSRSSGATDPYGDTPFLNARPGVAYVGDAVCAHCHREIAEAYRAHPMGRSLEPIVAANDGPPIGPTAGLPFEATGVQFSVERRNGRLFHRATRRGADGGVLSGVEAEVRYALGSGTRGVAYLIERDGFLFQSPIAWFAQQQRWDISPGYGAVNPRPNFERAIERECLFCHTSHVRSEPGTLNRYETPIFEGYAISCERCHGPGALHAKREGGSTRPDLTIVNPAHLGPALRESVCQQCHLQGWFRFPRAGRDSFDFRPGLPLHRFLAVFVRNEGNADRMELIGQVEQMESSRCYRESNGELGCISCHDPHRTPPPTTKAEYYRGRCLECHERQGCALPAAQRASRGPGEDCVACHMPRPAVADVPHTLTTDHRIPRISGTPVARPTRPAAPGIPGEFVPREYHWGLMTKQERREAARDRGVALEVAAQSLRAAPQLARLSAAQAVPLLEAAVRDRPDDLRARESLGYALGMLDRLEEARHAYEEALRIEPRRESALPYLARTQAGLRRPDLADAALREVIAVNPWRSDYRMALAKYRAEAGNWPGAAAACREALRLDPERTEARSLLVQCCLCSGEPAKADVEFQILLRFDPTGGDAWRQWYERQKRMGPGYASPASNGHP
jgi:Flp pilus assembly protein TadD